MELDGHEDTHSSDALNWVSSDGSKESALKKIKFNSGKYLSEIFFHGKGKERAVTVSNRICGY